MSDVLPEGYGEKNDLERVISTPDQEWVCNYLDKWFSESDFKPSGAFKGALAALSHSNKTRNVDWLAQSAHSMREIFYTFVDIAEKKRSFWTFLIEWIRSFFSSAPESYDAKKTRKERIKDNIAITQEEEKAEEIANLLNKLYKIFSNIAHHCRDENKNKELIKYLKNDFGLTVTDVMSVSNVYEQIMEKFVFVLKRTSENLLEIHRRIDQLLGTDIAALDKNKLEILIHSHIHARDYFFSKAPADWITWLHENRFFDVLNVAAEDKTRYAFRMPELGYLSNVIESGGHEDKVVEIMNKVDCVKNLNPEVVDQFLWIAQKLSVQALVKFVPKIKRENWVELIKSFKHSGYTYQPIVKKLAEAKESESLLLLAQVLLTLNEDKQETPFGNYFSLSDVSYTEIFDALADLEGEYAKKGIEFLLDTLKQLVKEKNENDQSAYAFDSGFYLFDVDLFDMAIKKNKGSNDREDLKSLIAVLVELIKRTIGQQCKGDARKIYDEYFAKLPDTHWMWRIQIFAMHFCPKIFGKELKEELKRFFSTDHYRDFLSGTPEFYTVLRKVFPYWSKEKEQRDFVRKVFEYFDKLIKAEQDEKETKWLKEYGWRVLSAIAKELTEDEVKKCEEKFEKRPNLNFEPEPSIGPMKSGWVQDRSPIEISVKQYPDISVLINDLKEKLSPNVLKEKYKYDDFLNPRNAEGVGNALKEDMKLRMSEYLILAMQFLDADLNVHYTYSFLRGIEEYLRGGAKLNQVDWENLFKLFEKYLETDNKNYVSNVADEDRWLARWQWVEKVIADILKYFLTKDYEDLFPARRALILEFLKKLLESEDPKPEDEQGEQIDLFHVAINSTRGVAFEAFVNFIYRDGDKLHTDVFKLYKQINSQASLSIRFMIGHYLASFYYRNKEKVGGMFEQIFPKTEDRYEEFFAAWQGYLTNILYKELFKALVDYYDYALGLSADLYPKRQNTGDEGEGEAVATHLALAFAHFDEVQYTEKVQYPLLQKLWDGTDAKKQEEFISFLGRGIISNGNAGEKWFKEGNVKLKKLQDFWLLILNRDLPSEIYEGFGFWVNHEKDVFDYKWLVPMVARTIEKSKGKINWDHGIFSQLDKFAEVDPKNTLQILEKYLLEGVLGPHEDRKWFYLDDNKIAAFKALYKVKPEETKTLINKLLESGGRTYWPLKDIVED